MVLQTGREIRLLAYPGGRVTPAHFELVEVPVPQPRAGEVLVRNTWTSVDPAIRLRLAERGPAGYFPSFRPGAPMDGIMTVGVVLESCADGFDPGDQVWHSLGWRELAVVDADAPALGGLGTLRRLNTAIAPATSYLGPLGAIGLTAYAGLFEVAELRDGDVVWVSAAAGAVGSLAAQFAKLSGHTVIGSAGSDAKVSYLLDELGLDAAFNHRAGAIADLLEQAAPDGIDVYFDSVGGDHLEAALGALRSRGRVALCGAISGYDREQPEPAPRNLFQTIANELTLRGFRGSGYVHLLREAQRRVAIWMAGGELSYRESVVDGLEHAPEALVELLAGGTIGKTLVRIAP